MTSKPPPSLNAPAGVPPSGNGKFIVVALLLLGLIGGAIVWKMNQKPPEPPPVTNVPPDAGTTVKSTRNLDDDIPLPPPVVDAGTDAGKKPTVATTGSNGCDVKTCTGQASSDLQSALAFRAKQAHRCYDQALAQDSSLKGKVTIAVRIGAGGNVCSATVANSELSNPAVANCVAGYFRNGNFPVPTGGCADAQVPINFVPRN